MSIVGFRGGSAALDLGCPQGDSASSVTRSVISAGAAVVRNGDTPASDGLARTATDLKYRGSFAQRREQRHDRCRSDAVSAG